MSQHERGTDFDVHMYSSSLDTLYLKLSKINVPIIEYIWRNANHTHIFNLYYTNSKMGCTLHNLHVLKAHCTQRILPNSVISKLSILVCNMVPGFLVSSSFRILNIRRSKSNTYIRYISTQCKLFTTLY